MSNIDKILKNKLENFQQAPPKDLLNSIRTQYPKKSFVEIIGQNKYYIIACVSALIVGSIFLINNIKPETNTNTISQTQETNNTIVQDDIIEDTNPEDLIINDNEIDSQNEISNTANFEQQEIKSTKPEIIYANVFSFNDTSVCGTSITLTLDNNFKYYTFPELMSSINNETISVTTERSGKYYIYYSKHIDNTVIKDSAAIIFRDSSIPNVSLSNNNLCYGEKLVLNYSKNDNMIPIDFNLEATQLGKNSIEISGLIPGSNKIQVLFTNKNNCIYSYSEDVVMYDKPAYSITSSPSFCSQQNGMVNIESSNLVLPKYTLNNEFESSNGVFTNLNPGIYYLKIEYASQCFVYDTLLVRDSLNISPYFIIEKDLVNPKKYIARNMTKLDSHGYEQSSEISFEWRVNGESYIIEDNPEFEFDSQGEYNIELIARLNNNCESIYSETIHVSGTCFRIPNIFTPNGDGIGDYFKVKAETEIRNYNIQIINKLGELVYEDNNINSSWDGKINGNNEASEGLYYYIIRGEDMLENKIEQKGTIQLVRN